MFNKVTRVLIIIAIFLCALFAIALIGFRLDYSYFIANSAPNIDYPNTLDEFLLYVAGYGDISTTNYTLKIGITVFSLFALTLLSSVLTISLFEWRSKLELNKNAVIYKNENSNTVATFLLKNKAHNLYAINAILHLSCGGTYFEEEKNIAFMSKRKTIPLSFDVDVGSVMYRYLRDAKKSLVEKPLLVFLVNYIDSSNGQTYTICKEFSYSASGESLIECTIKSTEDIASRQFFKKLRKGKLERNNELLRNMFKRDPINLKKCTPIRAENITIEASTLRENKASAAIQFTSPSHNPDDFGMMLVNNPFGNDWSVFCDFGATLTFDVEVRGGITVLFELKGGDNNLPIIPVPEFGSSKQLQHFSFRFDSISKDSWKNVREICFTVKDNAKSRTGTFSVTDLEIAYRK